MTGMPSKAKQERWQPASAVLLTGLAQSALLSCLPWLMDRSGLGATAWSWLLGGSLWGMMLMAPLWGKWLDRRGAALGLWLSFSGFTLALALLLLALGMVPGSLAMVGLLLVSRLVHSLFMAGVFPSAQYLQLQGLAPERWRGALARLSALSQLGRLLGPALVAAFAWWWPPLALLLVLLASMLLAAALWRRQRLQGKGADAKESAAPWAPALPLYLLALVITTALGQVQFLLGPLLQQGLGLSPEGASSLMGAYLALAALVAALVGLGLVPRLGSSGQLALGVLCLSLGGAWLGWSSPQQGFWGPLALLSAGLALTSPWYGVKLRERWPRAQGRVAGRLSSLHTLGYGLGMVSGGWLLQKAPQTPLLGLALLGPLLVALLAWQAWLDKKSRA